MATTSRSLFPLGRIHVSDEAFAALDDSGEALFDLLTRHQLGDWGDVDDRARAQNAYALLSETQYLRSVYRLASGEFLKVITDDKRHSTAVMRM